MRQKSLEIKINRKFLTAVGIMQGLLHTAKSYKDKSQDNTQYSIILTRIIYCAKLLNRPSSCVLPKVHTELIPFQKVWIIQIIFWPVIWQYLDKMMLVCVTECRLFWALQGNRKSNYQRLVVICKVLSVAALLSAIFHLQQILEACIYYILYVVHFQFFTFYCPAREQLTGHF